MTELKFFSELFFNTLLRAMHTQWAQISRNIPAKCDTGKKLRFEKASQESKK